MNFDKKRRARVQGGWAAPNNNAHKSSVQRHSNGSRPASSTASKSAHHTEANQSSFSVNENEQDSTNPIQSHAKIHSARTEKEKPTSSMPIWMGKNIDQPVTRQKFVYEEPDEEIKVKPADKVITKPGVYDISTEPSGVSRLRYFPDFIAPSRCDAIFAELFNEVPWGQRHDIHNGKQAIQPRLTAWYGDQPYTYGGVTVEPNIDEWPLALKQLKEQLAEITGIEFNALATNLYRDGHDSIGWHSDDEPIMGKSPVIASLSFGDERVFELRKKPPPNDVGERDYTYSQVIRVPIRSGALLIMEGWTQADWQHRVPKEYHDRGARINVTFRIVKPVGEW
ncbi:alpha-ketoglutarate-dependent dioxygenase alkB homolog 3 [Aplysia californica]|uniref:Alpha-ketoglutarate-dependent dioxygenase alkB homolog 3 n=1 Tax=Aplysia californica TaxID=6500 RepID=A0ABM0JCM8_APLCA|nr:alpha-ketoglutarate-dependent dioxygenase alkB homolog 3 [Aplysia californica]XP_005090621.1 alpha-ketoglutarate-dependent dioxygenase alkB homolog 3 [Aplysia californica]